MSNDAVRQAVEKTTKLFQSEPSRAQVSTPPVTACLTAGVMFRINGTRGEVQTDMPPSMGGQALAETPGWHMRAALASCIGTMIATRAAQLGIPLQLLEVTVLSKVDYRGVLGIDDSIAPTMSNLRPMPGGPPAPALQGPNS
jgi:putative redox protein